MVEKKPQKTATEAAYTGHIPRKPLSFMVFVSRPFWQLAAGVFVFATIAQSLSMIAPYILKLLVDGLVVAEHKSDILNALRSLGVAYVVITILLFICWRLSGIIGVPWLAQSKEYSFKILYDYLVRHSHNYFSDRFAGALANKVSHASDGADNLIEQITWHYYPSVISVIGTSVLLTITNLYIGGIFVALTVLLIIINIFLVKKRRPLVLLYAESSSTLRGVGVDLLTNISATRQYNRISFENTRLESFAQDRTKKDKLRDYSQEWGLLINNTLVVFAVVCIFVFLYFGVEDGSLTIGDVVLVSSLLWTTSYSLIFIGNMLNGFIRVYGEIEEGLNEILIPHEIIDCEDAKEFQATGGTVVWDNVTFDYGNIRVFNSFNLTIHSHERIGLVGHSGAGKSTFVSLLLRQHELTGGLLTIDGEDISRMTQDSLRKNIAVVPQEPILFHRSIRENIAYGKPDATLDEINAVAKKSQAHDFIMELPQGYDTLVGERGVKLSGGQKQRVAIARAMLKNAPILVLDEATSALDSESEVAIQKALHELMEGKTVVAIAHRLSTLREMDRIIVLEGGKIIEDGTHTKLVKQGGIYARLWAHQAGGFLQED